jgi:8-oxo-dGTP pyrophosphatase MutT (NUDIX family)
VNASEPEPVVRASGGLLRRRRPDGEYEFAIVHRPKYDDWSLPKGKVDADESDEDAAVREVEEETGVRPRLGREVGVIRYRDSKGRPKEVRYWLMEPVEPARRTRFRPNHEVDDLRWCTAAEASKLLSYEHDRRLIADVEHLA